MILETERLILRPIVKSDLNDIFRHAQNPNIGPNAGWKPHENKAETKKIMKNLFIDKDTIFGITLKDDATLAGKDNGTLVGVVGLENDPKRSNPDLKMIGYWLEESLWGKGIMTEAATEVIRYGFEELDLPMITSNCFTYNIGSKTIIEKLGMKFEGTLRQAEKRFDGKVFDLYMYSLTKDEYQDK